MNVSDPTDNVHIGVADNNQTTTYYAFLAVLSFFSSVPIGIGGTGRASLFYVIWLIYRGLSTDDFSVIWNNDLRSLLTFYFLIETFTSVPIVIFGWKKVHWKLSSCFMIGYLPGYTLGFILLFNYIGLTLRIIMALLCITILFWLILKSLRALGMGENNKFLNNRFFKIIFGNLNELLLSEKYANSFRYNTFSGLKNKHIVSIILGIPSGILGGCICNSDMFSILFATWFGFSKSRIRSSLSFVSGCSSIVPLIYSLFWMNFYKDYSIFFYWIVLGFSSIGVIFGMIFYDHMSLKLIHLFLIICLSWSIIGMPRVGDSITIGVLLGITLVFCMIVILLHINYQGRFHHFIDKKYIPTAPRDYKREFSDPDARDNYDYADGYYSDVNPDDIDYQSYGSGRSNESLLKGTNVKRRSN